MGKNAAMRLRSREEWEQWYKDANPWSTEGSDKDRVREDAIVQRLQFASFENLLDLGCGEGHLTSVLAPLSKKTLAFDIADNALERARTRYPHIEFRQGDLLDVIVRPDITSIPFDFVAVSEVLYYLQTDEERDQAFTGIARLGTPSCLFYFSVMVTGASKYRRYFTYDEFIERVSKHFNIIDTFPSVADMPKPLDLLRRLMVAEQARIAALRAWTATRKPERSRHLGCFAVKRGTRNVPAAALDI
jgi:SAM-dependent methyltransferase